MARLRYSSNKPVGGPKPGKPRKSALSETAEPDPEFLAAMEGVKKLDPSGTVTVRPLPGTGPAPGPVERPDTPETSDGPDSFLAPGVARTVLTELRSGKVRLEAEKDLHGMRWDEARRAIDAFITECQTKGRRVVCIVHGKGRQSPDGQPVLKPGVRRYLYTHRAVLACCSAHPRQGGDGAVLVKLRKR